MKYAPIRRTKQELIKTNYTNMKKDILDTLDLYIQTHGIDALQKISIVINTGTQLASYTKKSVAINKTESVDLFRKNK